MLGARCRLAGPSQKGGDQCASGKASDAFFPESHKHGKARRPKGGICRIRKLLRKPGKTNGKENRPAPTLESLSARRYTTFAKVKHGAASTKQAIAIGLSKARRAGVKLSAPKEDKASSQVRKKAQQDLRKGESTSDRIWHTLADHLASARAGRSLGRIEEKSQPTGIDSMSIAMPWFGTAPTVKALPSWRRPIRSPGPRSYVCSDPQTLELLHETDYSHRSYYRLLLPRPARPMVVSTQLPVLPETK